MPNSFSPFASRISRLASSPIREILHVLEKPSMISFAGGLPAVDSFPSLDLTEVPASALQYGPSEGDRVLRERIAANLNSIGLVVEPEQVFVLSGSQQGIDLVAKLFIEKGVRVALEAPTYLAALQVFRLFGADFFEFSPNKPKALSNYSGSIPLLYVNPTFQNPTGYCYNAKQRVELAKICDTRDIVVFEDDPYRDLAYAACDTTPIVSSLQSDRWVYQSSFSKTFAPGLRIGYLVCGKPLTKYFSRLKQAADLHSNRLSQHLICRHFYNDEHAARLIALKNSYREKRDMFQHYLSKHLHSHAKWSVPQGGLFFWLDLTLPYAVDTRELLQMTIEKSVAFMPGEPFFADSVPARNQFRLNFSLASEQEMDEGLKLIRACIDDYGDKTARSA